MDERWVEINSQLKSQKKDYKEPGLPFQKDVLIREFNTLYFKVYDKVKAVDL